MSPTTTGLGSRSVRLRPRRSECSWATWSNAPSASAGRSARCSDGSAGADCERGRYRLPRTVPLSTSIRATDNLGAGTFPTAVPRPIGTWSSATDGGELHAEPYWLGSSDLPQAAVTGQTVFLGVQCLHHSRLKARKPVTWDAVVATLAIKARPAKLGPKGPRGPSRRDRSRRC